MLKASVAQSKPAQSEMGMASGNLKRKNHPFYIASLFDVFAQLESDVQGTWGFRHSHMTIVTRGSNSEETMEWVICGCAYGALDIVLDVDGVYFLKGRLIALNQPGEQKFYYEPKNQVLATTSRELKGDLANAVSAHGLGTIISREVETVSPGKEDVHVIVRHSDYNPDIRGLSTFEVEYRCLWSPLMEKLQPLLLPNREVSLVGHIIGRNVLKHMWIVEITGVSVISGGGSPIAAATPPPGETIVTPGGRIRGKMIFDDMSPVEGASTPGETNSPEGSGEKPTANKRQRAGTTRKSAGLKAKNSRGTVHQASETAEEPTESGDPPLGLSSPTPRKSNKKRKGPATAPDDGPDSCIDSGEME